MRLPAIITAVVFVSAGLSGLCGCGAEDPSGSRRPGTPTGRPAATAGAPSSTGAFAGNGSATGTAGGTDMFGNPTELPPMLPEGVGPSGGECLEATVSFVIDGSGSMCEVFGASTRWQELRGALLAPQMGLVYRLQDQAKFGLMIYDGSIDISLVGMSTSPMCAGAGSAGRLNAMDCMQLVQVPPSLGNADPIAAAFPMRELGGSTPTDRAMNQAVDALIAAQAGVDLKLFPQFIVLATDGQPNDICVGGMGGDGVPQQQAVIAAVDRAAGAGIKTFVISLAGMDAALQMHLDEVARHGNPADAAAHTFTPANSEELVSALATVLGNALGCNVL